MILGVQSTLSVLESEQDASSDSNLHSRLESGRSHSISSPQTTSLCDEHVHHHKPPVCAVGKKYLNHNSRTYHEDLAKIRILNNVWQVFVSEKRRLRYKDERKWIAPTGKACKKPRSIGGHRLMEVLPGQCKNWSRSRRIRLNCVSLRCRGRILLCDCISDWVVHVTSALLSVCFFLLSNGRIRS